eukprot:8530752-Alexandrium_andersonii.AAC.1
MPLGPSCAGGGLRSRRLRDSTASLPEAGGSLAYASTESPHRGRNRPHPDLPHVAPAARVASPG